ncbi:exosortase-associated protein EpsI, V-type [Phenylobacterium sp.]|uniref:exosortase-associated protein EpsI, V-type n=1 Tax=Phenylobacterium sp. TaxID=1871053 RepID=UPI00301D83D6
MRKRDLILGGLALASLGAAEALRPRNRYILLKNTTVDKTLPLQFGAWEGRPVEDLIGPELAGRLAQTLYSETVARVYFDPNTGASVMLLAAYGDTQSDLLQLHRPESCYPAVGFSLEFAQSINLPLPGGSLLPARRVIATTQERRENILYWTRMGERLPRTGGEQRVARFENSVQGYIPDGILIRCSAMGASEQGFAVLDRFVPELLKAVAVDKRPALVGTRLAREIG